MDSRRDRHLGPCGLLSDALAGHRPAAQWQVTGNERDVLSVWARDRHGRLIAILPPKMPPTALSCRRGLLSRTIMSLRPREGSGFQPSR